MADSAKFRCFDFVSSSLFDESNESAAFFSPVCAPSASDNGSFVSLFEKFRLSDLVISMPAEPGNSNLKIQKPDTNISFYSGVEITPSGDLTSHIQKSRKKADFLSVRSADEKMIRSAVESAHVDLINPISISIRDKGYPNGNYNTAIGQINHIVAKLAADNHVAFGFDLFPFLQTRGFRRSRLFAGVFDMIPILQKYDVPILISSGAKSVYDLRDSYELIAFGELLGLSQADAQKAVFEFPKKIIEERQKILSGQKLSNGVEIDDNAD
ncbi:RNase P subunit p30 family protein [Methanolapillus millepedarum]|uniref:Ribonuclease P protein component 3 n=1 Tax=Methanolapillus millepedarum TaxID=3028296 RepID=A0AA96V448_9EURY|nr:hypothetical protein MsAc7_01720 [Methanosarcinaceae archaeon Ac7]